MSQVLDSRTIIEVLTEIGRILEIAPELLSVERRAWDIRHSFGDTSRVNELLGWTPQANWKDSVKSNVDWLVSVGPKDGSRVSRS